LGDFPFASVAVVSDPAAVRQILVEDQSGYLKSTLERRVLSARLRNGLVAVDGEQWRRLRRILAPLFARKTVIGYASQMAGAVESIANHWRTLPEGSIVVMKTEMLRLALEALMRCIFADGIGDPKLVHEATTEFYSTCGTLDPFDLLGFPDFVPRLTRLRERPILRAFDEGLYRAIAQKRRTLADGLEAPRDMLGAMVSAKDPETGQGMSDREVKDNVMTFIFGGQETTSSALTWAFYLLSQSAEWRERVLAEANRLDSMTWHEGGRRADGYAGCCGGGAAPLSADHRYYTHSNAAHGNLRSYDQTGHPRRLTAIRHSPPPAVVARPRSVRPHPLPPGWQGANRALHVSSIRHRPSHVRGRDIRRAGGDAGSSDTHASVRSRCRARRDRLAGAEELYHASARRTAHDGGAPMNSMKLVRPTVI